MADHGANHNERIVVDIQWTIDTRYSVPALPKRLVHQGKTLHLRSQPERVGTLTPPTQKNSFDHCSELLASPAALRVL